MLWVTGEVHSHVRWALSPPPSHRLCGGQRLWKLTNNVWCASHCQGQRIVCFIITSFFCHLHVGPSETWGRGRVEGRQMWPVLSRHVWVSLSVQCGVLLAFHTDGSSLSLPLVHSCPNLFSTSCECRLLPQLARWTTSKQAGMGTSLVHGRLQWRQWRLPVRESWQKTPLALQHRLDILLIRDILTVTSFFVQCPVLFNYYIVLWSLWYIYSYVLCNSIYLWQAAY